MTTVKELRKDIDEIKTLNLIGDSKAIEGYRALMKTLAEYSRLSEITPDEIKCEAIAEVLKDYSERRGVFSDIPT